MRFLLRPVTLLYALGMLALGIAVGLAFADAATEWRATIQIGLGLLGTLMILTDNIVRQARAASGRKPARE
jgi:hypothetical protein